jgi:hypothetical protein
MSVARLEVSARSNANRPDTARIVHALRSAAPALLFGLRLWTAVCLALYTVVAETRSIPSGDVGNQFRKKIDSSIQRPAIATIRRGFVLDYGVLRGVGRQFGDVNKGGRRQTPAIDGDVEDVKPVVVADAVVELLGLQV